MAWSFVPVVLSGPSSTGKTTVADAWCMKHNQYNRIQEVARDVMKRDNLTRDDLKKSLQTDQKKLFLKLQEDILIEQNIREAALSGPFISDRGLDPLVYVQQHCNEKEMEKLLSARFTQECISRYRHCLIVILSPLHTPPKDDGVRLVPDNEEQFQFIQLLKKLLDKLQIPFVYINESDHIQRMKYLENAVFKHTLPFNPQDANLFRFNICFPMQFTPSVFIVPTIEVSTDCISLTTTNFVSEKYNRMIDRYGSESFAIISFHNYVTSSTAKDILSKGVWINGVEYQLIGCSSSGLKQRKCYLFKGDISSTEAILAECGSFMAIKSVSKQLKRIAQLFSAAIPTGVEIKENFLRVEEDIETKAGNFTDGCGLISENIALKLMEGEAFDKIPQMQLHDYNPSVFQIRYEGCKGIVTKEPSLSDNTMIVRKSMKKFDPGSQPFKTIWLCDYSKPYSFGHINKQFIILFSALGIKKEVFLKKQANQFEDIKKMTIDPETAIMMLGRKHPELAMSLIQHPSNIHETIIQNELKLIRSKCIQKLNKLRILIPDSRNIFGVPDPIGVLRYGECFVRPTIRGQPHTLSGYVTVSKNPCYLLGDVRVLTAVCDDRTKGLEHLVDCIVFPIQGNRPHSSEIAGSDLDGDMYFVCWDSELIVPKTVEPYDYPSTEAPVTSRVVTHSMRVDFITRQNKESRIMGKIDRYFNYWASFKGANCDECVTLGKLFSRSVDATKTGDHVPIPARLKPPDEEHNSLPPVWDEMEKRANDVKHELQKKVLQNMLTDENVPLVSESFIWSLIQEQCSNFSEIELFHLVRRWCQAHDNWTDNIIIEKLIEFSSYINFGKFTVQEQKEAIDVGIPRRLVTNALNKSKVLSMDDFYFFSLHSSKHEWRQYFYCTSGNFNWQHFSRAVERNSESLIIFRLPDGILITVHFLRLLQTGFSDLCEGSVVAYFFSKSFGYKRRHVLGHGYNLHFSDEILQIYRHNDKRKTFLWLRKEIELKSKHDQNEEVMFNRLSVDLTAFKKDIFTHRHPKVNKQEFLDIEVFVKKESTDPTYFDIHLADQWDVAFPEEMLPKKEIEDIPMTVNDLLSPDSSEFVFSGDLTDDVLKGLAERGNCALFLSTISKMSLERKEFICDILLKFLTQLHITNGHQVIDKNTEHTLEQILNLLMPLFTNPFNCLILIEKICWLNVSSAFLEYVGSLAISKIEITDFSTYFDLISVWKTWSIIPFSLALQIAKSLNELFLPFVKMIPNFDDIKPSIENSEYNLHKYIIFFLHRMLLYFLADIRNQLNFKQEGNDKVIMLKASLQQLHVPASDRNKVVRISFHKTDNVYCSNFTIGTNVFISPMKSNHPVAIGRITSITKTPPDIILEIEQPVPSVLLKSAELQQGHWELRLIGNVTLFNRSIKALKKLMKKSQITGLLPLLINPHTFYSENSDMVKAQVLQDNNDLGINPLKLTTSDLLSTYNESQNQAIDAALKQRITLIHGPPGTGKTHVACGIVEQYLQNKTRVLVTSETNLAVDNLTRRLLHNNIQVVRLGNLVQISPDIRHVSLHQLIDIKRLEYGRDEKRGPFLESKYAHEILEHAQVISTTCAGAGDPLLEAFEFHFVLIDEATLVIEPVSLIPIVLKSQQLVLIGDPQQLSPQLPVIGESGPEISDLTVTLFHRFQKILPSCFLNIQHRMHPAIVEFPSSEFYDSKLMTATCLSERQPFNNVPWINSDSPCVFVDISEKSSEKRFGTSYCNYSEAELIDKIIKLLLNNEISPLEITVLTPYIGQVRCITQLLSNSKVQVSTIDRFQGQENDVIVFSSVRCNPQCSLGFTDDQYRMNVLLTRAKRCLIGVGCSKTLQNGSLLWNTWLKRTKVILEKDFIKLQDHHSSRSTRPNSNSRPHQQKRRHKN